MRRFALAACLATFAAGTTILLSADSQNPFIAHSDTGDTVHELPGPAAIRSPHDTQPTFAPVANKTTVYPASYGSGNLIDHGGLDIGGAGFRAIYWNASASNSTQTSLGYATLQAEIDAFITNFPDNTNYDGSTTDDFTVVQQYGSHAAIASTLINRGAFVDTRSTQSSINDSKIQS